MGTKTYEMRDDEMGALKKSLEFFRQAKTRLDQNNVTGATELLGAGLSALPLMLRPEYQHRVANDLGDEAFELAREERPATEQAMASWMQRARRVAIRISCLPADVRHGDARLAKAASELHARFEQMKVEIQRAAAEVTS